MNAIVDVFDRKRIRRFTKCFADILRTSNPVPLDGVIFCLLRSINCRLKLLSNYIRFPCNILEYRPVFYDTKN